MVSQRDAGFLAGDAEISLRIKGRVEGVNQTWVADGVVLDENVAEIVLVLLVQLAVKAKDLAVVFERIDDIEIPVRPNGETPQFPKSYRLRKAVLIQRLAEPLSVGGIDMDVVQRGAFVAAVKADVPFFCHVARCP